jgi:hypothetical protein
VVGKKKSLAMNRMEILDILAEKPIMPVLFFYSGIQQYNRGPGLYLKSNLHKRVSKDFKKVKMYGFQIVLCSRCRFVT